MYKIQDFLFDNLIRYALPYELPVDLDRSFADFGRLSDPRRVTQRNSIGPHRPRVHDLPATEREHQDGAVGNRETVPVAEGVICPL